MVFDDPILAEKFALETERGYWTVAGKYFFNKAECLKYASAIKDYNVKYLFLNSTYRSLNWRIEPKETMEDLYKLRAQQIRSKYDYVFLFYSGGADSTNILDTFMDNNIPLDEVVTCYPISVIEKSINSFNPKDKDKSNVMFEYILAAQPKLKELSTRYPNTKITVVDYAELSRNFIIKGNLNKVFQSGLAADPYHTSHLYVAEKMRALSDTKSVCAISGIDKPRIMYDMATGNFGCYFHDLNTIFGKFSEETLSGYIPKIEYFYYTTDLPTLMQKQCFVLKHTLIEKAKLTPTTAKEIISKVKDNRFIIYNSHTHFFRTTLYSKWNDNTWQADKDTTNYFYQSNSKWFHTDKFTEKRYMDYYEGQVNELINGVDEIFIERSNGKVNKFIDFISSPIIF
jgi:hypothetical protein